MPSTTYSTGRRSTRPCSPRSGSHGRMWQMSIWSWRACQQCTLNIWRRKQTSFLRGELRSLFSRSLTTAPPSVWPDISSASRSWRQTCRCPLSSGRPWRATSSARAGWGSTPRAVQPVRQSALNAFYSCHCSVHVRDEAASKGSIPCSAKKCDNVFSCVTWFIVH